MKLLTIEALEDRVGAPVYDPYRRRIGTLVSFDSEVDGRVTRITVMTEDSRLIEYPAEAVEVEGDRIIVKPRWKTEAEITRANYIRAVKRMKSLEEMYRKREVPEHVYKLYAERFEKTLREWRERLVKVREMLKQRLNELEIEKDTLIRTKTALRIAYLSGEVNQQAYRAAWERIRAMEESLERERKDLEQTLKLLEELEEPKFIESRIEKREENIEKEERSNVEVQPIPVKIIG